jgi:hypothetical protein
MKAISLVSCILLYSLLASAEEPIKNYLGSYSVSGEDQSGIILTVNEDKSFVYKDFSNPEKPIEMNGKWEIKGNKIVLNSLASEVKFHNVWKIDDGGNRARSRHGLSFYTLRKPCKENF